MAIVGALMLFATLRDQAYGVLICVSIIVACWGLYSLMGRRK